MAETSKNYSIVSVCTNPELEDSVSEWFQSELDMQAVHLALPDRDQVWVEAYFDEELKARIASHMVKLAFPSVGTTIRPLEERDWAEYWKKYFQPQAIGKKLWICPPWIEEAAEEGRNKIVINPGLSFGTGEHFTTRFCLQWVDQLLTQFPGSGVADLGTGIGIIAICAARLGASLPVLALDNDPVCIEQSALNAERNGLGDELELGVMDLTQEWFKGKYDVVFANLYSGLLIPLAPQLIRSAQKRLVITGVQEFEADGVATAMVHCGGREIARDGDGEWCGMVFEVGD